MTVTIQPLAERDFFAWYELFTAYAAGAGLEASDEQTMRVWTTLQGGRAGALIATDGGQAVGFVHYTIFERLLQGDSGFQLEDVFVSDRSRNQGVATALIEHVRTRAEEERRLGLRWSTRGDDPAVNALGEKFAASTGGWVLHDLPVG